MKLAAALLLLAACAVDGVPDLTTLTQLERLVEQQQTVRGDLEEEEGGGKPLSKKTVVVDVHQCSAIPLLEKWASFCNEKPAGDERAQCMMGSLSERIAMPDQDRSLLSKLLGVLLLSLPDQPPEARLLAWDWLDSSFNSGSFVDKMMSAPKTQAAQDTSATTALSCMAEIGKAVATSGAALERGGDEQQQQQLTSGGGTIELDGGVPSLERERSFASCAKLLVKIASKVANSRGWNQQSAWRIEGALELQQAAVAETETLLDAMPDGLSRSTMIALKQVLCVLTLFGLHFSAGGSDGTTIVTTAAVSNLQSGEEHTYEAGRHERKIELARVVRGTSSTRLTSYRQASDEIELVETMLRELERLYEQLTQAVQRESMRLELRQAKEAQGQAKVVAAALKEVQEKLSEFFAKQKGETEDELAALP